MRLRCRPLLAALVASLMLALPARAQWVKSPQDLQREAAHRLEPSPIHLRGARAGGELRVVRLRVYAAEDYRRQTFDWESRFRLLIARVNRVVESWPGVRFEIESIRPWPRTSSDAQLGDLLVDLRRLDAGEDVDRVVGLVAAVPLIPTQIDNIALASHPGRHFVLRSLHDLSEYAVVQGRFDELFPVERERLLMLRKQHKEVVVFLHEWAHTLGLIHARRAVRVMNPSYDHTQAEMSETEAKMVEAALRVGNDRAALGRELLAIAEASPDPEWDARDRQALRTDLEPRGAARPVAPRPSAALPEAITTLLVTVDEQIARHEEDHAEETLRRALAAMPEGPASRAAWKHIASEWVALSSPSAAVAAADRAGDRYGALTMRSWSIGARRRLAIPFDAAQRGLPPEREGTYARALSSGLAALADRSHRADVVERAELLEREFPQLPGGPILRCGLLVAGRALAQARSVCDDALRGQDDALPTLRLLADLATAQHLPKVAAERRRQAAELDR